MTAFYNEIDPYCAQWLRNLIDANLIAPGVVDERSIEAIQPFELDGYAQCHFFAGIGVWSYALRLAGVADSEPVWTGSCPCQPFSIAAVAWERKQFDDERHLWPQWNKLIAAKRPKRIFGEQVSGRPGLEWFDLVANDLEKEDYAVASAVLPARTVTDHIRYRQFFTAYSMCKGWSGYQHVERIPESSQKAFPFTSHTYLGIRRALEGDYTDLLLGNDVAVGVERSRAKGYGNAIVAQVAAEFVKAALTAKP